MDAPDASVTTTSSKAPQDCVPYVTLDCKDAKPANHPPDASAASTISTSSTPITANSALPTTNYASNAKAHKNAPNVSPTSHSSKTTNASAVVQLFQVAMFALPEIPAITASITFTSPKTTTVLVAKSSITASNAPIETTVLCVFPTWLLKMVYACLVINGYPIVLSAPKSLISASNVLWDSMSTQETVLAAQPLTITVKLAIIKQIAFNAPKATSSNSMFANYAFPTVIPVAIMSPAIFAKVDISGTIK